MGISIYSLHTDHQVNKLRAQIGVLLRQEKQIEIQKSELTTESQVMGYARGHQLELASPASVIYLH